jgi:hypothetical protein
VSTLQDASAAPTCDACFSLGARRLAEPSPTSFGPKVAPEIAAAMTDIARRGLLLCPLCEPEIRAGREVELRHTVCKVICDWATDHTDQTPLLAESELGITLASWTIKPFEHPAYTTGFRLLNVLLNCFPRATIPDGTAGSVLERDLGNGVIAIFTVIEGTLVIDNFVSQQRGRGFASHALDLICAIADAEQCPISGYVQPNSYAGIPLGLAKDTLHHWYARCGFERSDRSANAVIRLPRPAGPSGT